MHSFNHFPTRIFSGEGGGAKVVRDLETPHYAAGPSRASFSANFVGKKCRSALRV